jgi:exopolysaccharide biosynthesis protein
MLRKTIFLYFVFCIFLEANTKDWKNLTNGISYKNEIHTFEENRKVLLHSFKIKQNKFKILIKSFHDLNKTKRVTLKELRVKNNYLIAISGGFYLPKRGYQSPQGLIIENRKKIFPIDKKLSGILWIKNNYLTLSTTNEIPMNEPKIMHGIDYAIQGYPRIVDPINKIGIRKQGNSFHRVAICTEMKSDDIILFITDKKYNGITLLELAKIAQNNNGFNCNIAVNLDGGPAPGISVSKKLINLEIEEGWQLPNAIIFTEK